nr:MAG TPA: hypothetical protein [Caudoviricetes sp.]
MTSIGFSLVSPYNLPNNSKSGSQRSLRGYLMIK